MVIFCARRPITARTGFPASRPAAILFQAGVRASRASAPTANNAASPAAGPVESSPNTGFTARTSFLGGPRAGPERDISYYADG